MCLSRNLEHVIRRLKLRRCSCVSGIEAGEAIELRRHNNAALERVLEPVKEVMKSGRRTLWPLGSCYFGLEPVYAHSLISNGRYQEKFTCGMESEQQMINQRAENSCLPVIMMIRLPAKVPSINSSPLHTFESKTMTNALPVCVTLFI